MVYLYQVVLDVVGREVDEMSVDCPEREIS